MTKQTAVEWLMEQISYNNDDGERCNAFIDTVDLSEYFNQAKEMEKEQIIDAHGAKQYHKTVSGEQYYNITFKNKNNE